jgi:acetyl-CoA synthetase/medium-chain acyl-CoA synthetase
MHGAIRRAREVPGHFNFATDIFDRWAQDRPDSLALWTVNSVTGSGQKFTYCELSGLSHRAANVFAALGVRKGDKVMVVLPRIAQWWIVMLGLTRLGAVPVPGTLQLTERDITYRLEAAEVAAIVTNPAGIDRVGEFEGKRILVDGSAPGWIDFDAAIKKAKSIFCGEPTHKSDPGILYFTSATTGEPKMVLHSQVSFGLGHRVTGELWLDLKPGDIHWNLSDLGWAKAAWSSFYGPWHMGACVFALDFPGKFDPSTTLDALEEFPITTWCAPPTALRLIVRQDLARWRFKKLRHCVTAGEPLNAETLSLWHGATGLMLHEGYGQTETVVLVGNYRSLGRPVRPGSMGMATPGYDVVLLDDELLPVPDDHEGEVALRIKPERPIGLFREYWKNEPENATHFQGQWYLTGDRACRDRDGYHWFVGRKDDVIKSSGYRIGPFEVESALLEHPTVLEVAVVGVPDPLRGQLVKAFVVLRPGYEPSDELKATLQTHCRRLVAAYKYPREIEFIKELPKTISGKTRHTELRRVSDIPA